ncbi:ABC transporter ATP-binding protein uup, partial [Haemophilus influenzae]
TLEKSSLLE